MSKMLAGMALMCAITAAMIAFQAVEITVSQQLGAATFLAVAALFFHLVVEGRQD